MTRTKKLILGGALSALVLGTAAFAVVWFTLIPHDTPARVTLDEAVSSISSTQSPSQSGGQTVNAQTNDLSGAWALASNAESFVGYRVKEELASVGAFTAVGRTTAVTGSLQFDGATITGVQVDADLTALKSDSTMRDGALRRQALETGTYPTATFALTQPIALGNVPAEGQSVKSTATGDLTLHGVTRTVTIDLEGQIINGMVVVVGSTEINFADYNIAQPKSAAVLSVEDHGTLELQLVFQQAA
jgi:polyisoprenoid-binding protein YceI